MKNKNKRKMNTGWGISETISNILKTCNWHSERKVIAAEKKFSNNVSQNIPRSDEKQLKHRSKRHSKRLNINLI